MSSRLVGVLKRGYTKLVSIPSAADYLRVISSNVLVFFIGIFSSVAINRSLSMNDRGEYGLLLSAQALAATFLCLGLPNALNYVHIRSTPRVQWSSFVACGALTSMLAVVVFAVAWLALPRNAETAMYLEYGVESALLVVQAILFGLLRSLFLAHENISKFARLNSLFRLLTFAFVAAFALAQRLDLRILLWITIVTQTAVIASYVKEHWQGIAYAEVLGELGESRMLRVGLRNMLVSVVLMVIRRVDIFMVDSFLGTNQTALYSVALSIFAIFENFSGSVGMIIANAAAKQRGALLPRVTKTAAYVTLVVALGLAVFLTLGERALTLMYGKRYEAAFDYVLLMSPYFLVMTFAGIFANAVAGKGYPKGYFKAHVLSLALTVPSHYFLIKHQGVHGLALSLLLNGGFLLFLLWRLGRKVLREEAKDV